MEKHSNGTTSTQWTYDRQQTPYMCIAKVNYVRMIQCVRQHFHYWQSIFHCSPLRTHAHSNIRQIEDGSRSAPQRHIICTEHGGPTGVLPFLCPHFVFINSHALNRLICCLGGGGAPTSLHRKLFYLSAYPFLRLLTQNHKCRHRSRISIRSTITEICVVCVFLLFFWSVPKQNQFQIMLTHSE